VRDRSRARWPPARTPAPRARSHSRPTLRIAVTHITLHLNLFTAKVYNRNENLSSVSSSRHVMSLVPAVFAVVSIPIDGYQPALGPRGGLWHVLLMN
jgi:hypothetical protein